MRDDARALVDAAAKVVEGAGREDLLEHLDRALARLQASDLNVLVVGEFKQGKSSLVNALVNAPICPVDDDIATAVPTHVRYSPQAWARAHSLPTPDGIPQPPVDIPIDQITQFASESGNPQNRRAVHRIEIGVPRQLLAQGLVIVDTPGVGGLDSVHATVTLAALHGAEGLLFVSDAAQELTATELDFLDRARRICPNVVHVVTKIDLYPRWGQIVDLNRGHLRRHGIEPKIIGVSSSLRQEALRAEDPELNAESGFPVLMAELRDSVVAAADEVAGRAAVHDVAQVVDQLARGVRSEIEVLSDPHHVENLMGQLERAKRRADDLRSQVARWQTTLGDGFGDLRSDIEFDLRRRTRGIATEAEEAIDLCDPAEAWEELERWLYERTAAEIVANFTDLGERVKELAEKVATHFEQDASAGEIDQPVESSAALSALGRVGVEASLDFDQPGAASSALSAARGSFGGLMMFNMLSTGLLHMVAFNPAVLVAGLVMGRKTLKDEKERQLTMRRRQALVAVKTYLDEVNFQVGKESQDAVRRVQRELRDHFATRAEQLQRSSAEAVKAAQDAVRSGEAERVERLAAAQARLAGIEPLEATCTRLLGGTGAAR